jgi:hypothetical protein
LSPNLEEFKNYDAVISKCASSLLTELKEEQLRFLNRILNSPKKINRIFRASEHDFSSAAFHTKCNGVTDTLVLVRTEFGKTIGGFTNHAWNSSNTYVNDPNSRTFLFSLDLKEKYTPVKYDQLIYPHQSYGPCFGGGHDLCLYDQCHINSSYANFPFSYNLEGEKKYDNGK